jgi:hypothetical protein
MSRTAGQSVPKYARHKASGQAVVTIAGIDRYLGPYGSVASRAEYDRVIAEWLANGRQATGNPDSDLTVAELIQSYQEHVEDYYVKRGRIEQTSCGLQPVRRWN